MISSGFTAYHYMTVVLYTVLQPHVDVESRRDFCSTTVCCILSNVLLILCTVSFMYKVKGHHLFCTSTQCQACESVLVLHRLECHCSFEHVP